MKLRFFSTIFLASLVIFPLTAADGVKVIAHRGFWNTEGSAQNSIAALKKAAQIGCYGAEFDVNVTKDGIPIINHDGEIDGKRIEQYPYSEFKNIILSNGERIPTLEEYLLEGSKYPEMKLVLEIKSASTPELESKAVKIIMNMVNDMKLSHQIEYIAFSLHVVKEILKAEPDAVVAYLNSDISPSELKKLGVPGLDYHIGAMYNNPQWFDEAHKEGLFVNVWTVNDEENMRKLISMGADFITTDNPCLLKKILQE